MKRFLPLLVLTLAIPIVAGCGGKHPRAVCKGKVTVGGKGPLTGGSIGFVLVSDSNVAGTGSISATGEYMVPDAPIGECKVIIGNAYLNTSTSKGTMPTMGGMGGGKPKDSNEKMGKAPEVASGMGAPSAGVPKYMKIGEEFATVEKTPLKATVSKSGAVPADFDVK